MKKLHFNLLFILVFLLFFKTEAFAFNEQWYIDEKVSLKRNFTFKNSTSFYSTILKPNINSIKFRQDDSYYYFDYDIDYKSTDIKRSTYVNTNGGADNIFVSQLKDKWPSFNHSIYATYNGDVSSKNIQKTNGDITFGSYKFTYTAQREQTYDSTRHQTSNKYTTYDVSSVIDIPVSGLNTDYYYNTPEILHNFYFDYKAKKINGLIVGNADVTSNATSLSNDYWHYNYKGTIKILKTDFIYYRYLTLLATDALQNMKAETITNDVYDGHWDKYDLRGNSIDLQTYCTCNHEWQVLNLGNKTYHEIVCKKCELYKKENHEMLYEYDGIAKNECLCGYHGSVNVEVNINDDINGTVVKKVSSFDPSPTINKPKKTGYDFLYYNLYEIHKENDGTYKDVLIGTRTLIDSTVGNYSLKYTAVYKPITYIFHFSNVNNLDLELHDNINDQKFTYDVGQIINDPIYVNGKKFIGWSLKKNSNEINFNEGQFIKNYTDIGGAEYILYPIYDQLYFYIKYITDEGKYSNGSNEYLVKYSYDDNKKLEVPAVDAENISYIYNDIVIASTSDLRSSVTYNDQVFTIHALITYKNIDDSVNDDKHVISTASNIATVSDISKKHNTSETADSSNTQNTATSSNVSDIDNKDPISRFISKIVNYSGGGGSTGGAADTSSSYGPSGNFDLFSGNITIGGIGPGENINSNLNLENEMIVNNQLFDEQKNEMQKPNVEDSVKNSNLLYIEQAIDDDNYEIKYSENYDNLMNYLREKYENEKNIKELENINNNDNNSTKYIDDNKSQIISNVAKKYGGVFMSVMAVVLSGIWTFLSKKI